MLKPSAVYLVIFRNNVSTKHKLFFIKYVVC